MMKLIMKKLKEIYELLEDTSTAIMIFKEAITITEEKPFFKLQAENNKALFFIDEAYDLVKRYNIRDSVDSDEIKEAENFPLIACGWIKYNSEDISMILEDILLQLDEYERLAVIRKIIRKAEYILYLKDIEFQFISCMVGLVSYGTKERFVEVEGKGQMSVDELFNLIASLVIVSVQSLFHLGTNCVDFGIKSAELLVKDIFPDKIKDMNIDFFDNEHSIPPSLPIFNCDVISKIYNKCNGIQWEHITEKDFIILLNSNGENQSLSIKENEINRTKCVFRKIATCIKDKGIRKTWIEGIKKNIFEGVDFMKAAPQTNKCSGGYSETDIKFKSFLDSL